jgi:hypothetical protein
MGDGFQVAGTQQVQQELLGCFWNNRFMKVVGIDF